jgi:hypothetical protein
VTVVEAQRTVDIQNHFYGHAAILAAYAGRRRPRHVAGLIQHGWTTSSPLAVQFGDFPTVERSGRRRLLVWTDRSRAWDPAATDRPTVALGAPFAYLARAAHASLPEPSERSLIMPLHGTRVLEVLGDQDSLAKYYRETEGPSTVCLHADDVARPEIVAAWQRAGHRLVMAGQRHDPDFLGRILALVAGHRRIVSNRLMTSIMYAASLGREVAVHGDPLSLGGGDNVSLDWIERTWPEMHGEQLDVAASTAVARDEIGWHRVLPPEELVEVLGWTRPNPGPALDYWMAAPLQKARNVLGLGERAEGSTEEAQGLSPLHFLRHPLSHLPKPLPRRVPEVNPLPEPISVPEAPDL